MVIFGRVKCTCLRFKIVKSHVGIHIEISKIRGQHHVLPSLGETKKMNSLSGISPPCSASMDDVLSMNNVLFQGTRGSFPSANLQNYSGKPGHIFCKSCRHLILGTLKHGTHSPWWVPVLQCDVYMAFSYRGRI